MAPPEDNRYGTATVEPSSPVVAGSSGTWRITYTAGKYGIDDGGALRVAFHTISDWGTPQLTDPAAPDYCTISWSTPAPCRIEARYDGDLGVRPWKRVIVLRVRDAAVRPGDTVTVTIGDRSGGSPGASAQTFAGKMRFQVLLDAYGTGIFFPAGDAATLDIVAGPPDHLRINAPSDVVAGESFDLTIAIRDRWGNVVSHRKQAALLDEPGVHYISVVDPETGLRGVSNPVRCRDAGPPLPLGEAARRAGEGSGTTQDRGRPHPEGEGTRGRLSTIGTAPAPSPSRIFWGDLHAQSEETIGSGTLDDYFTFARDCAAIDVAGHQGNDFQITREVWQQIMRKTQEYDAANEFITFAGYEWSGNTPGGGDHNVHFFGGPEQEYDLHRSSHWQVLDRTDEGTDRFPVSELYETFRGRDDVILIPHVGGRYADLQAFFDESLMPLVEIASCWGVFEWFVADAFQRGTTFGFSAGSDDHTARPGMSHAPRGHFATGGGLTAVLAPERSRQAIWDALRARRTYATTGARMLLDVVANGRHPMGAAFAADDRSVELAVEVHGTAPLWRVEVYRWPDGVYAHPFEPAPLPPGRHRLRIGWTGSRIRARHRLTCWDGVLTVGSGRFARVEGWGFDHPENGVTETGEQRVRWRSETAGDWDGIVVELDAPDNAALRFATSPVTFAFTPRDVAGRPLEVDAGGVGQLVRVERDPGPDQPRSVSFTFRDEQPPAGRHPYFVRVTQQDGNIGWSSPVYVTVRS
ncbi:MAG: DUF3604 domain-containing protein [Chloroflexi bacterium]|nr:DUF3604 domain-containing protein [Chloroflexota bacterium]